MQRRDFLTASAGAGALALPGSLAAQPAKEAKPAKNDERAKEAEPLSEAELLVMIARRQYGERLDEEQFEFVRREIVGNWHGARAAARLALGNGDEPVLFPSSVYRWEAR
jgi:hypothetical protein